jgi:hypothetical protein
MRTKRLISPPGGSGSSNCPPAASARPLSEDEGIRFFKGVLLAIPLGIALWVLFVLIVWSVWAAWG